MHPIHFVERAPSIFCCSSSPHTDAITTVPHGRDGPGHAALASVQVPARAGPAAEAGCRDVALHQVGDAGEDGVDERRARGEDHGIVSFLLLLLSLSRE